MINGLILSFQFFSRIPINIPLEFSEKNIRYSIFFMPLVGAIIGGAGGLVYYFLHSHNIIIASFLALLISIILTGGLHIDGLSDTIDGFMSNKNKDRTLEIMKDSRIGAFGVLSIVLLIMFKFILVISIESLPIAMILSFTNSRLALGYIISFKKMAKEDGLGSLFKNSNPKKPVILCTLIYLLILALIDLKYLLPLLFNFIIAEYISSIAYKKINGLTGDVYGAIIEIGEAISLLCFWGVMTWI